MKLGGLRNSGRELLSLFDGGATAGLTDGQLLDRFANGRGDASAEAAFAALVARHGPMVWGTCRRILRDSHAADDAFQATFLVLVKKARSVRVDGSLGRWLHGVGVRVALRARAAEASRGLELAKIKPSTPPYDPTLDDLRAVIDEELERLPSAYRSVVVLCLVEGLTRERAANWLGCPVGTVNSRLSRAEELLKSRLTRRGLAPASGGLMAWLGGASQASASVPQKLVGTTLAASASVRAGATLVGIVPASVTDLTNLILRGDLTMKMTMTTTMLVGVGFATVVAAGLAKEARVAPSEPRIQAQVSEPQPKPPSLDERVKAAKAEWEAGRAKHFQALGEARTEAERAEAAKLDPDVMKYGERFLTLAETDLGNPAARDALLWVVGQYWIIDFGGDWSKLVSRATDRLIEHHSDDLYVAWAGLSMDRYTSPNRDKFLPSIYERARSKRTRGAAVLALAQYRWKMSLGAFGRKLNGPPIARSSTGENLPLTPEH
jgi:RNA polymerase sigma factor (sigma-70 family)